MDDRDSGKIHIHHDPTVQLPLLVYGLVVHDIG